MTTWIDFKELRRKLDFEQVLRFYQVEVRRKGKQHHGFCPLPNHNGKKNSMSFSADLERGIFHCFGCGAKGNVLEFAALMEGVDPYVGNALRTVAIKLQRELRLTPGTIPGKESIPKPKHSPIVINAPLDFELKGLDYAHPYLKSRGFNSDTVKYFGLGVASRGSLKGRLAIPLNDHSGQLIGYAGRVIDDQTITNENPRYRFPSRREHDGKVFGFRKTLFLYNGFRIKEPVDDLIVVESFTAVWWLHQAGFPHVVATMGADFSERQVELIVALVKLSGKVWCMPDGDTAGERLARSFVYQGARHRFVRWVKLTGGHQPTDASPQFLNSCFTI